MKSTVSNLIMTVTFSVAALTAGRTYAAGDKAEGEGADKKGAKTEKKSEKKSDKSGTKASGDKKEKSEPAPSGGW